MPLKNMPQLSDRLKYVREQLGLTQGQLGDLAGTTQQAIQQAEDGKTRSPRYLFQIAEKLEIPFEWLMGNKIPKKKKESGVGVSDKDARVLDSFFGMSKKDQKLILELMKSKKNK